MARTFNLNPSDLPCIIVTNNFEGNEFCWFKTCPEHVHSQLINLGYIAEEYSINNMRMPIKSFTDKKYNVDLCSGFNFLGLAETMAEAMSDCLAFYESMYSDDRS